MEDNNKYLTYITDKLKERIASIDVALKEGAKEVEDMHEYYWENYTEMDEYGYENFDNQQALLNQVNSNNEQLLLKQRFRKMLESPYFGRVDFKFEDEDEDEAESFYIGIGNFSEGAGNTPLIYDWRAPISSLFYDFDKGEAYYNAPAGRIDGEITSKWQYKIRDGKLIYAFESDVKIDDEVLKQELGSNGEVKLKNIIRTIQKEQNAIIRNTEDKILVIQGVAGSGKTSVALHRIAYLLYHNRETIKASNILILSPNGVFADYISHILPELGEENIMEMSFDLFAYKELSDIIADCEDRYDQIEKELTGDVDENLYSFKQSKEYITKINGFVLGLEDSLMKFRNFKYAGIEKLSQDIMELFYYKFPDIPLLKRMDAVMDYIVDEFETLRGKDFEEEDKDIIRSKFRKMYKTTDLYTLYNWFLEEEGLPLLPQVSMEQRKLPYEDLYPMLYLRYQLYGRSKRHSNIRHLVIDEMQDYSYLQYTILEQLFKCRMTILGDKAQTMESTLQDVTKFLPKLLGKEVKVLAMNKSYRNTMEIAGYANAIMQDSQMELFERHGEPVKEFSCDSLEAALEVVKENLKVNKMSSKGIEMSSGDFLESESAYGTDNATSQDAAKIDYAAETEHAAEFESVAVFETAAVIAMTEAQAKAAYEILKKFIAPDVLSYVDRDSKKFKKGLVVTTFYCAKGLEFDQVFAIKKESDNRAIHRQAQYIAATRALHELFVITEKV